MKRLVSPVIVILGAPNDNEGNLLSVASGRARAALREYRREPSCHILLTGGFGEHFNKTNQPHCDYLLAFLLGEGVPEKAILGKVLTANTIDDAQKSAEFLAEFESPLDLRVVTSDFHLARARYLFERAFEERARLEMIAAPSGLSPGELGEALRHEANALGRFA